MHPSALNNGKLFFDTYSPPLLESEGSIRVVEIGSQDVNGSIRQFCPQEFEYIGVDFVDGKGVDVVIISPYELPFDDNSVDIVVSSSCFEHSEMFWVVYLEIIRILKPHGVFYLNVPSNGMFHRYPVDCWRFYPDSGPALVTWAQYNNFNVGLMESYTSNQVGNNWWNDFVAVYIKNKEYIKQYPKRILYTDIKYTNGILDNLPVGEFLNFQDYSEDHRCRMMQLDQLEQETQNLLQLKIHQAALEKENQNFLQLKAQFERENLNKDHIIAGKDHQLHAQSQNILQLKAQFEREISNKDHVIAGKDHQLHAQSQQYHKYKKLWTTRLLKPLIKTEQALSSANNLRKGFYRLVKARGSVGKAYQYIRRLKKAQGFRAVKSFLRSPNADGLNPRFDYAAWLKSYDTLSVADVDKMKIKISEQKHQPLISIVMPTYNPNTTWLIEAIESVQAQIYTNWELCIADDCSTNPKVRETLQLKAMEDQRIKLVLREQNGHISAASNSALALAQGEWVALMDHDDLLPIHALYWVMQTINQHPDAQLIYSDEDKIDEQGNRCGPYFKCDWNVDLFYAHNMFSHLGVYRKTLIDQVGGFRLGFEGSQDYDLVLRCVEQIEHQYIYHIPKVLYHWRVHPQSTAQASGAKPYAAIAGEKALNEHFQRVGLNARSVLLDFGMYRTQYTLPDVLPLVSLIIPTRNAQKLVKQCVESILDKTTYSHYEIIIVDNGSDNEQAVAYFKQLADQHSNIFVMRDDRPFNYSQLNNHAVQYANGELIGLINNDIEVISPDWLSEMVSIALQKHVGAVGAKLYYPNNTIQHAGVVMGVGGVANHAFKHARRDDFGYFGRAKLISSYSAVTAACLIVKKSIFLEVGGLDEANLTVAFNDVDFCLKVKQAGYRNVWTPYAEMYHHESISRGAEDTPIKMARFKGEIDFMRQHWEQIILNDPAYSPNLTVDFEDFSLACPPRVSKT